MKHTCAWCQKTDNGQGPETHGICQTCFDREIAKIRKTAPHTERVTQTHVVC